MIDPILRTVLLNRARGAVARRLGVAFPEETGVVPERGPGAFVTLYRDGDLRGCRGMLESAFPLHETVEMTAALSAFDDPRFPPVTAEEWPDLGFEISVIGHARDVRGPSDIHAGVDGLLLTAGRSRGFLLPQVADRVGGDMEAFLEALCDKAGLPPGAWTWKEARLQAFPVEHFA